MRTFDGYIEEPQPQYGHVASCNSHVASRMSLSVAGDELKQRLMHIWREMDPNFLDIQWTSGVCVFKSICAY